MGKQVKGKGRAVTIPIKGVENAEAFIKPGSSSSSKAVPTGKVDQSGSEDEDEDEAEDAESNVDEDEEAVVEDDDDDEEDEDEEEYEVDEKAMNRLMELLGDVDDEELGLAGMDDSIEQDDDDASELEDDDDDEDVDEDDVDDDEALDDAAEAAAQQKQQQLEDTVLDRITARIKLDAPFFETQTLTCPEPLDIKDVSDDLSRELQFYKISLWAARHASKLFKDANVPFSRPNDYYAEMLKSDEHMEKIRQKLLDETANIKASEQAKKQRHLKKFGKQVQVEKQKEREKAKKDMNDKVKSFRKKRKAGDNAGGDAEFDISLLDSDSRPNKRSRDSSGDGRGKTRTQRDAKFGRPQTSRRPKQNDRESTNAGFGGGSRGRGGSRGGRGGGRGGSNRGGASRQKRPGKSKRQ